MRPLYLFNVQRLARIFVVGMLLMSTMTASGQTVVEELKADPNRAAGNFYALPIGKMPKDTPAPEGKKPFYINHYGCPGSYYREMESVYEEPYAVFAKADSLGKLTKLGQEVKKRLELLRSDAKGRFGELTSKGAEQSHEQIRQIVQRFPEMFTPDSYFSSRSIVQNNCIMTAEEAMVHLSSLVQPLDINLTSSHRDNRFMDPQDKALQALCWDSLTQARYDRFMTLNTGNARLMKSLFNDQNYLIKETDPAALSRQLYILAGCIQHTDLAGQVMLYDLFTPEEIMSHWKKLNAKYYIINGACTLNGGKQPFMQRATLRNMIHMGDSAQNRVSPMAHLRFTHENVVMALACLMELDDCGLQTDNLDELEEKGWWCSSVFPMAANLQFIFYRSSPRDKDVLMKVLLNEQEATLPIATDCTPYYHWADVRNYCLGKLENNP